MLFIYNIAIKGYALIINIASLFNKKAKFWVNGRKNWHQNLLNNLKGKKNIHWFHCASLGEFEQGLPLMEKLKERDPSISILVTFFSPSGYEIRKNYYLADYVCYLPIDSKKNATKFILELKVTKAFFIKYEFWFHYFTQLKKQNIPFYMVSSVFRDDQPFFKWYGSWYRNILKLPTAIFVQNKKSQELLNSIDIKSVLTGDTRYDKVNENAQKAIPLPLIEKFKQTDFLIIAGSSWQEEEEIIAKALPNINTKLIVAPHDISKHHINKITALFPNSLLYSKASETNILNHTILIIDNIGMLSNLYQYGDIGIVGGGFSGSLHNILEPATFGLPVLFGKKHIKFIEANNMIKNGAGYEFNTAQELTNTINSLIKNNSFLSEQKEKNKNFININIGATKKILSNIF
jgi:3-deoxy-D-manno-octulosonic-acid transferase